MVVLGIYKFMYRSEIRYSCRDVLYRSVGTLYSKDSTGTCTCPTSVLPPAASSTGTIVPVHVPVLPLSCPRRPAVPVHVPVLPLSYPRPSIRVVAPHTTVHAVAVPRLLDSSWYRYIVSVYYVHIRGCREPSYGCMIQQGTTVP